MYITRIAPSPTGAMHIGTLRTAYFNWLAARQSGGKFILRIDDTDQQRNIDGCDNHIIDTLIYYGLNFDSVEYQSKRLDIYKDYADKLISLDLAYKYYDSILLRNNYNIGFSWFDELRGDIKVTENDFQLTNNMCLIKKDGYPSYNFASIVDDIDMNINFIIRGSDHITNTSKQLILWKLLINKTFPKFAHVGLICRNNVPLSKRDQNTSTDEYRKYLPEAVLNFVARIGWSPIKDDKSTSLLPKERMLAMFLTEGKMKSSNANLDLIKLESFDRKYKAKQNIVER